MIVLGIAFVMGSMSSQSYTTSQLVNLFKEDKVSSYTINYGTGAVEITLKDGVKLKSVTDIATSDSIIDESDPNSGLIVSPTTPTSKSDTKTKQVVVKGTLADVDRFIDDISVYTASADEAVSYNYIRSSDNTLLYEFLPILVMGILLVAIWVFIMKKMGGGLGGKEMNFGKAKIKNTNDEKRKTTFDDVAGADEEKEELQEIVEFLKAPDKYNKLGARIPKGVLLVGPPGTGKTLLARAVAGEAGVPFFSISGSDFVEMFVGVGASRVRDLFEQAKKNSPCIIFIDEIDAVGRQRGAGLGGGHDEREQTLNQLLVEMDGFGANEGVILIAATNRPDVLDPALMRPGRFDRQVIVSYPDINGREAILKVHARKKPLAPDVKLKTIAKTTAGFTGADLENLLNEAALLAARKNKKAITMEEIEEATIKVVVGAEKKTRVMSDKEKKLTAYHEAGHAICFHELATQDPVHEISIIPRGMAGGYTLYRQDEDSSHLLKSAMLDRIISAMGGRVAEQITFGDISTGASQDIAQSSEIARSMVTKYGMSEKLGPVLYGKDNDEVFLGMDYSTTKNYS
ncbi:ATP-dependent zinc metalloprotease FtsH, partial [Ruminococcus sp.]|uniref:ATP-dependent zinc metalloprotease FtsH n=1 Tax=Ruminococcus sp. TaxID=41978 RepID=UPI0038658FF9